MSTPVPPGDLRISDADRDRAIEQLREHFHTGRLTSEEFEERSEAALRTMTERDLGVLFADLPQDQVPAAQPAGVNWSGLGRSVIPIILAAAFGAVAFGGVLSGGPDVRAHPVLVALIPVLVIVMVARRVASRGLLR
jgi:Flp pilus assembly protein TadB